MSELFPTFKSLWQRAKRVLSTDISEVWQCAADEDTYLATFYG